AEASMEAPEGQLRAEAGFREAGALAEALGMRPLRGRTHLGMARLAERRGLPAAARDPAEAAASVFRELGMLAWLRRAEELRARIDSHISPHLSPHPALSPHGERESAIRSGPTDPSPSEEGEGRGEGGPASPEGPRS
ncbi:MAG TPA: hypothetical protein VF653_14170, partial [Methylomirabilota bacterium]